jgi:hypothetical protein
MTDTKSYPDADYQALLGRFAALGYDTAPFVKFVHTPEQIGQPGVWSNGIKYAQSPIRLSLMARNQHP